MNFKSRIAVIIVGIIILAGVIGLGSYFVFSRMRMENAPRGIINVNTSYGRGMMAVNKSNSAGKTYDDVLSQAVSSGLITSAQKDSIDTERTSVQSSIDDINNQKLTTVQRQNEFTQLSKDIYNWANQNNIPVGYLGVSGI